LAPAKEAVNVSACKAPATMSELSHFMVGNPAFRPFRRFLPTVRRCLNKAQSDRVASAK
jgi:hypothetical protein